MNRFFQRQCFNISFASSFKLRNSLSIIGVILSYVLIAFLDVAVDSWSFTQANKIEQFSSDSIIVQGVEKIEEKIWLTERVPSESLYIYHEPIRASLLLEQNGVSEEKKNIKQTNIDLIVSNINFKESFPVITDGSTVQTVYPELILDNISTNVPAIYISKSTAYRLFSSSSEAIGQSLELNFFPETAEQRGILKFRCKIAGIFSDSSLDKDATREEEQYDITPTLKFYMETDNYLSLLHPSLKNLRSLNKDVWVIRGDETLLDTVQRSLSVNANITIYSKKSLFNETYSQALGLRLLNFLLTVIILVFAGINMMNIVTFSVKERTKEIAIRRILGATKTQIRHQICLEMLAFSVIGSLIGAVLTFFFWHLLYILLFSRIHHLFILNIRYSTLLASACVCIGSTLFFSIFPASIAANTPLTNAMHEDL